MKNFKYTILSLVIVLLYSSCSNSLDESIKLDINVVSEGLMRDGDIFEVKKSEPVKFEFTGNPDFIVFYSGEVGAEYDKRFETELSVDEIDSELTFKTFTQYGKPENSLNVFLSTSFPGLTLKNEQDKENVHNMEHWKDISDKCNLPIVSGGKGEASISLNEYLGKELILAFWYTPKDNTVAQSKWIISDLKIVNTLKKTGDKSEFTVSSMGFTAFDEYVEGAKAYEAANTVTNVSGQWNLGKIAANPTELNMHSTGANKPLNSDWLISIPLKVNSKIKVCQ